MDKGAAKAERGTPAPRGVNISYSMKLGNSITFLDWVYSQYFYF